MTENQYQAQLIKKLKAMFPNCVVLKNDSSYQQGVPDLTILWDKYWALLEVKMFEGAEFQPNQRYYIQILDDMSFAACIYPENEREVLGALQQAFKPPRRARVS